MRDDRIGSGRSPRPSPAVVIRMAAVQAITATMGDGDREDDDLLLRLAALCRRLGAQAVGGRRAPWSRVPQPGASPAWSRRHLGAPRHRAQRARRRRQGSRQRHACLDCFGAGGDKVAIDLRGHNSDD